MARLIELLDPTDHRLDDFRHLTTADRRPDRPGGQGLVIAEGVVVVRRLLASRYPVRALLGVHRRLVELAGDLGGLDVPAYLVSAELMAEVVGFHLNRGVLAVADRAPATPMAQLVRRRTLAVLEGINDHENLGVLFRNAAALGLGGVLLGPRCANPLYRRSVRVSMGHVLRVPFGFLPNGPPEGPPWPAALDALRGPDGPHGVDARRLVALTPRPEAVPLAEVGLAGARVALLLGAEGPGLSDETLAAADVWVRIPMADGVDSLNVATAAAIAFQALR